MVEEGMGVFKGQKVGPGEVEYCEDLEFGWEVKEGGGWSVIQRRGFWGERA